MFSIKKIAKKSVVFGIIAISLPLLALAEDPPIAPEGNITQISQIGTLITKLMGWLQWLLFLLAGVFIIWAALVYLTAGGDDGKLKTARQMIINAVIAIAIGLLAVGIQAIVRQFFTIA